MLLRVHKPLIINHLKTKKPLPKQEAAFLIKNTEGCQSSLNLDIRHHADDCIGY
jgi:hypothetical protein